VENEKKSPYVWEPGIKEQVSPSFCTRTRREKDCGGGENNGKSATCLKLVLESSRATRPGGKRESSVSRNR
jgi:hypothetical protein